MVASQRNFISDPHPSSEGHTLNKKKSYIFLFDALNCPPGELYLTFAELVITLVYTLEPDLLINFRFCAQEATLKAISLKKNERPNTLVQRQCALLNYMDNPFFSCFRILQKKKKIHRTHTF